MDFNIGPYYDDFEGPNGANVNNYMRIMFKPGFAVQARELTQTQSILQNQIKSFGDNVFKNGSPVSGGHLTYDNTVTALQIGVTDPNNNGVNLNAFNNQLIVQFGVSNVNTKAKVLTTDSSLSSGSCAGGLIIKYTTGNKFANTESIQAITAVNQDLATIIADPTLGSIVSINQGIFYVDGYFVNVSSQTIVLDSLSTTPSFSVGLELHEEFVNFSTDSALLDPAQGSFNYQAPGADRYKFNLVLAKRLLTSTDTSTFFELMRIENGIITSQINYSQYNQIEKEMAARTYDQSGNFTVNPFIVTAGDNPNDNTTFLLNIDPGKAYVKGFEFETISRVSVVEQKALTQNTSNNYAFTTNYGSYFITNTPNSGSQGFFDFNDYQSVDFHCVPSANINTNDSGYGAYYANTKIGTARIRDIEYFSTNLYSAYVLDINMTPIVANAAANGAIYNGNSPSPNTSVIAIGSTGKNFFSTIPNAYANSTISILSGNCSGDVRTVIGSSLNSGVGVMYLYVDVPFSSLPDGSPSATNGPTQYALNVPISSIKSIVENPTNSSVPFTRNVYTTQGVSGILPCLDVSSQGTNPLNGSTVLNFPNQNTLIFKLPNSWVSANTFHNVSFYSRLYFPSIVASNTGGNFSVPIGTGATALGSFQSIPYINQNSVPQIMNSNILVTVKSVTGSGFTLVPGSTIIFDGANTVTACTNSLVVNINPALTANLTALTVDVMYTVETSGGNFSRYKTAVGNSAITSISPTDNPYLALSVQAVPGVNINTSTGCVWFTDNTLINQPPGTPISLYIPDVTSIVKIFDSGDPNFAPNSTNAIDITQNFSLDSGQRDNYYDYASLYLNSGFSGPVGQTAVFLTYYNHSGSGFFSANSYPSSDYEHGKIPTFVSPKLGSFNLRDCVDFRPTRVIGTSRSIPDATKFFLVNNGILNPTEFSTITYDYYLPRIDKLTLTSDKQFKIANGIPSLNPVAPPDSDDAMTLYTINIPPYTLSSSDVVLNYVNNRRYTMKDIGGLEQRIDALEYYTILTQLQQQAMNQKITYQDGSSVKSVYGVVTDSFTDYSIADTLNSDLYCGISSNTLTAFQTFTPVSFMFNSSSGSYSDSHKTTSLNYTEVPYVSQNTATETIPVQEFGFGEFIGTIGLTPQTDFWYSTTLSPQIIAPAAIPPAPANNGVIVPTSNTTPNVPPSSTVTTQPKPKPVVVSGGTPKHGLQNRPTVPDINQTGSNQTPPPLSTVSVVRPVGGGGKINYDSQNLYKKRPN